MTAAIVLGLVTGGYLLVNAGGWNPLSSESEVQAEFEELPAVSPGTQQEVRMAGVKVGKIVDAEPTKQGHGRLTMTVDDEHTVYDNAQLVLRPKNPLNEMYVEMDPGGPPGKPLGEGEVIPVEQTQRPVQADEVLKHLDTRTQNAITQLIGESDAALANAPEEAPRALRKLEESMDRFQPIVQALGERNKVIEELMTDLADISAAAAGDDQRLVSLIDSVQQVLAGLSDNEDELRGALEELPGTTEQLRNSMKSVSGLTEELDPALKNIDAATHELPDTVESVDSLVGALSGTIETADPVVEKARPLVDDLQPVVGNVHDSLDDLSPVTQEMDYVTAALVPFLDDLGAFVYNTHSLFTLSDDHGGLGRGHLTVNTQSVLGNERAGDDE
ncbi:MlaD family protein [Haloechinothrix alba]|nr:MlaD family protein [Haloechinothrix alba]